MAFLFTSNIPEHFNKLVLEALNVSSEDLADESSEHFIKMFLGKYLSMSRPLTGYFMICCVVEIQWTILAQAIIPIQADDSSRKILDEAQASNAAWLALSKQPISNTIDRTGEEKASLTDTINGSLQLFYELLSQVQEMDPDSTVDTYAWETMAESLV
jgi:phosphatidylinositol 4-kinase